MENKIVVVKHITTEKQLADIFTKALNVSRFISLRNALEIYTMKLSYNSLCFQNIKNWTLMVKSENTNI